MDIKYAKKRLLDSEQELSYSQRIAIANLLDKLTSDMNKFYENRYEYDKLKILADRAKRG